ncbi:MAG: glycosyltransferase [Cyclobacteriaceae bacterium]
MNLILIGPYPPAYFGQSLAFKYACDILSDHFKTRLFSFNLNLDDSAFKFIIKSIFKFIKLLFLLLLTGKTKVYISASRGKVSIYRDLFVCAVCLLRSHPYVLHVQGNDLFSNHKENWFIWPLVRVVYEKANDVIVLNKYMNDEFKKEFNRSIKIINNCFNNTIVHAPSDEPFLRRPYTFIYLSNLHFSKGIIHLVDAFKKLKNSECSLLIAGEPLGDSYYSSKEIKEIFLNRIKEDSRIEYLGTITSNDIKFRYLEQSSFFILPSFYPPEAFPLSIIEAMSSGCVIITTNHNGIDQYQNASNNFVIDVKDLEDEITLHKYLENCAKLDLKKWKEISQTNVETATNYYTLQSYQNKILSVLRSI